MIDNKELKQIAYLARLSLNDAELQINTKDLNSILGLVEQLSKIETQGIKPMAHPLHMTQRLRTDKVAEIDQSALFQSIAPSIGNAHYLVPTVIE